MSWNGAYVKADESSGKFILINSGNSSDYGLNFIE
jgi:hypothetical protein